MRARNCAGATCACAGAQSIISDGEEEAAGAEPDDAQVPVEDSEECVHPGGKREGVGLGCRLYLLSASLRYGNGMLAQWEREREREGGRLRTEVVGRDEVLPVLTGNWTSQPPFLLR